MEQMLKIMFSDNPNLPEELYTFCNSIPNYVRAEREYLQLDACYLFGLGLRRELAAGLMLEE